MKDINLKDLESGETFTGFIDGTGFTDTLKLSNKTGCVITSATIIGGSEDCIDINRGGNHLIRKCTIIPRGRFGITIKGGASGILIEDCIFDGHGSEADIDLGNWSDQSQERTRNNRIVNCRTKDGSPIRTRCEWADKPIVEETLTDHTRVHPILLWFFKIGKKLGVV